MRILLPLFLPGGGGPSNGHHSRHLLRGLGDMTAREIADRLFHSAKGVTGARVRKAQGLASRSQIAWSDVLAAMTPEERAQLNEGIEQ